MSKTIEFKIYCDSCTEKIGVLAAFIPNVESVVRYAETNGWSFEQKKDLCPKCKEQ